MIQCDTVQLLRIAKVVEMTSISRSSIYNLIKRQQFPQPVRITPYMVAWRSDELQGWMTNQANYDLI